MENVMRYLVILIVCFGIACKSEPKKTKELNIPTSNEEVLVKEYFEINTNNASNTFIPNENIDFDILLSDSLKAIDSIQLFLNNEFLHTENQARFSLNMNPPKVGKNNMAFVAFFNDGSTQRKEIHLTFLSDIIPEKIAYSVVKTYPHSSNHFTQGLVYENGFLYEGTGEYGFSTLVKTKLKTSEIVQSLSLPANRFGEGIAVVNNKIVQLTYKSGEGYVYDKTTFEKIWEFTYPHSEEGWGLTSSKSELLMSDGSHKIISLDTSHFAFLKEIEVYDNTKSITNLNELEYVDGLLYANIWMENSIAQIDPTTGKVLGYLDFTSHIPDRYKSHHAHVLNGIAVIPESGHLLITGKRWDIIYEIKLEKEN